MNLKVDEYYKNLTLFGTEYVEEETKSIINKYHLKFLSKVIFVLFMISVSYVNIFVDVGRLARGIEGLLVAAVLIVNTMLLTLAYLGSHNREVIKTLCNRTEETYNIENGVLTYFYKENDLHYSVAFDIDKVEIEYLIPAEIVKLKGDFVIKDENGEEEKVNKLYLHMLLEDKKSLLEYLK